MSKVVFLRLRNRTLNKFKVVKAKKAVKKVAKRAAKPNQIKKTLRVVNIVASPKAAAAPAVIGKASPQQKSSKSPSPVAKQGSPVPKIGARTLHSIIGHRRMFLRNRRLMELAHRPMISAF